MDRMLFYDTETNGLNQNKIEVVILSLSYLDINLISGQVYGCDTLYFYNKNELTPNNIIPKALEVNGLCIGFLKEYENDYYNNIKKLYTIFYRKNICGFCNKRFDDKVLYNEMIRNNLGDLYTMSDDVYSIAKRRMEHPGKLVELVLKLGFTNEQISTAYNLFNSKRDKESIERELELSKKYRMNIKQTHNAFYDVIMTYLCYKRLVR